MGGRGGSAFQTLMAASAPQILDAEFDSQGAGRRRDRWTVGVWYRGGADGDDDVDEEGTGGPETGAPTEADGGAQRDGGGGSEPVPSTECSEHTAPIGRTENPWGVPGPVSVARTRSKTHKLRFYHQF